MNREGSYRLLDQYIKALMEESRPQAPVWNQEGVRTEKSNCWSYVNALFINALLRLNQLGQELHNYLSFADHFMEAYIEEDGTIHSYRLEDYNIDHICGGTVLMDLYSLTGKEKYRLATELLIKQLQKQPRTPEGSFWHKWIYPNQVWLDGLYMAQPFYMRYGAQCGDFSICRDSFEQFLTAERHMKDPVTGLYYHGYDQSRQAFWCNRETGLSSSFWLRSIGWFAMACVDVMEAMPEAMHAERQQLNRIFQDLMDSILVFQEKGSHMWFQVPDQGFREGNYLETSGSAMLAYAMRKGNRLHYLDDSYRACGGQVFDGISQTKLVRPDGLLRLGGICLVAGLGGQGIRRDGSYEYYISEPVAENDGKGVGPFVLAYTELLS